MKDKKLFKEIGLIDDNLIANALTSGEKKHKKRRSKQSVALVACAY